MRKLLAAVLAWALFFAYATVSYAEPNIDKSDPSEAADLLAEADVEDDVTPQIDSAAADVTDDLGGTEIVQDAPIPEEPAIDEEPMQLPAEPELPEETDTAQTDPEAVEGPGLPEMFEAIDAAQLSTDALEENGFLYEIVDGTATITGYKGTDVNIVIPADIAGVPVASVGDNAFMENHSITSLTVPKGVQSIGDNAFNQCTALKSVSLPPGLISLGDMSFHFCSALTDIVLPEGLEVIGNEAFHYCPELTELSIPSSVREIGEGAFRRCEKVTSFTVPEGVTQLNGLTFHFCKALKSVTLPRSLKGIGEYEFLECTNLKRLTIPAGAAIDDTAFLEKHGGPAPRVLKINQVRFLGTREEWQASAAKKNLPANLDFVVCDNHVINAEKLDLRFDIVSETTPVYRGQPITVRVTASGRDADFLNGTRLLSRIDLKNYDKPIYPDLINGTGRASVTAANTNEITGTVARISAQDVNIPISSSIPVSSASARLIAAPADANPDLTQNPSKVVVGQLYTITIDAAPRVLSGTLELEGMRIFSPQTSDDRHSIAFSSSDSFSCVVETTGSEPVRAAVTNAQAYGYQIRNITPWEPELEGTDIKITRSDRGPIYPGQPITLKLEAVGVEGGALRDEDASCTAEFPGLIPVSDELKGNTFTLDHGSAELNFIVADAKEAEFEIKTINSEHLDKFKLPVWSSKVSAPSASISAALAGTPLDLEDLNPDEVHMGEEYTLHINRNPGVAQGTVLLAGMEVLAPESCVGKSEVFFSNETEDLTVRITGTESPSAVLTGVTAYERNVADLGTPWAPKIAIPYLEISPIESGPYYAGQPITLSVNASQKDTELLRGMEIPIEVSLTGLKADSDSVILKDGKAEVPCKVSRGAYALKAEIIEIGDYALPEPAVWCGDVSTPFMHINVAPRGAEPVDDNPDKVKPREEYVLTISGSPGAATGTLVLRGAVVIDSSGNEITGPIAFSSLENASYTLRITGSEGVSAVLKDVKAFGEPIDTSKIRWKPILLDRRFTIWPDEFGPYYPGQPVTLIVEAHGEDAEALAGSTIGFETELNGLEPQTDTFELEDGEARIPCIIAKDASSVSAALSKVGLHPLTDKPVWQSELSAPSAAIKVSKKGESAQEDNPATVEIGQEFDLSIEGAPDVLAGTIVLQGLQVTVPAGQNKAGRVSFRCPDAAVFTVRVIGPEPVSAALQGVTAYGCDVVTDASWSPSLKVVPPSPKPTNTPVPSPATGQSSASGGQSYYPPAPAAASTAPDPQPTPAAYGPRPELNPDHEHAADWGVHDWGEDSILEVGPLGTPQEFISGHDVVARFLDDPNANVDIIHLDGTVRDRDLPIVTGHRVRFTWPDDTLHNVHIVVKGDVHGTGMHGLYQIVRMAKAYTNAVSLSNLEARAADMDSNGRLDLTDIIKATRGYIDSRS